MELQADDVVTANRANDFIAVVREAKHISG